MGIIIVYSCQKRFHLKKKNYIISIFGAEVNYYQKNLLHFNAWLIIIIVLITWRRKLFIKTNNIINMNRTTRNCVLYNMLIVHVQVQL